MMGAIPVLKSVWPGLDRRKRRWLGRSLRRAGLSYGEIRALIPVPKGTLAGWCRDIELSEGQTTAIRNRTGAVAGAPRDTQHKRRAEIEAIRRAATDQARTLITEPLWVAGVALYWGEGSKTSNELSLANSDPQLLRVFVQWVLTYLDPAAEFVLKLNLHADNDEVSARLWWEEQLDLPNADFHRTYIKREGTGHRRNHLPNGVCLVRMRRSTDAFHIASAWIEALADLGSRRDC